MRSSSALSGPFNCDNCISVSSSGQAGLAHRARAAQYGEEEDPAMAEDAPLIVYGMHSPNVRKVLIMLEELEQPYELRHVAVFSGEQFTPEFLAMNPLGKVPVLVDPKLGAPVAESGAILFWLAERSG